MAWLAARAVAARRAGPWRPGPWRAALRAAGARGVSTSTFELFKIGVGPSSSHTVGPMRACNEFLALLDKSGKLDATARVRVDLFGSLALTGKGHATDLACVLGLSGVRPDKVAGAPETLAAVQASKTLKLGGGRPVPFDEGKDLVWNFERKKEHANAVTLTALGAGGETLVAETYFSIGGGFIRTLEQMNQDEEDKNAEKASIQHELNFRSMGELLDFCKELDTDIAGVMRINERAKGLSDEEIDAKLDRIWQTMDQCISKGLTSTDEFLPGSLKVRRRARTLYEKETRFARSNSIGTNDQPYLPMVNSMSRLSLYAIAVNEQNAAVDWSPIVTAPTNGAAGVVPACLKHLVTDLLHARFVKHLPEIYQSHEHAMQKAPRTFLLTAAAVGALIKRNASISGAEAGCMGEVGSASSMAAAGLTACLGGSPDQVENAAEIAMEHSLGLTCDPIEGLVQIPCIERNAMGACKAMNAASLAIMNTQGHSVKFDTVIEVAKRVGEDMKAEYRETSLGGRRFRFALLLCCFAALLLCASGGASDRLTLLELALTLARSCLIVSQWPPLTPGRSRSRSQRADELPKPSASTRRRLAARAPACRRAATGRRTGLAHRDVGSQ